MQMFRRPASLLAAVLLFLVPLVDGGHVLVFPGEYSHWLNMRSIMEELVSRNHSVTVLVSEASPSVKYDDRRAAAKFNFLVYQVRWRFFAVLGINALFSPLYSDKKAGRL